MEIIDLPLEDQLESRLEVFREVRKDFYSTRERLEYLGGWLFRLSIQIQEIKNNISNQSRDQQLEMLEGEYYAG